MPGDAQGGDVVRRALAMETSQTTSRSRCILTAGIKDFPALETWRQLGPLAEV